MITRDESGNVVLTQDDIDKIWQQAKQQGKDAGLAVIKAHNQRLLQMKKQSKNKAKGS